MSGPGGESPVTREELRSEIRKELRETLLAELRDIRGPADQPTRSEVRDIVSGEVRAARGELITRAELRQTVNDAVDNLKENIPSKDDLARAENSAAFAVKGFWTIFAAILAIIVAAAGKYFWGK